MLSPANFFLTLLWRRTGVCCGRIAADWGGSFFTSSAALASCFGAAGVQDWSISKQGKPATSKKEGCGLELGSRAALSSHRTDDDRANKQAL